jgi:E3 ubiquitin-protein ligase SH3RF
LFSVIYYITERCQDGWFKGINQRSQKSGVFPGNYVAPMRTRPSSSESASRKSSQPVTANAVTPAGGSGQHTKSSTAAIITNLPELPPRNNNDTNSGVVESTGSSLWLFSRKSGSTDKSNQKSGEHSKSPASSTATKDSSAKSLMKKLTNMKRSKSPTTFDNPSFEDTSLILPSNSKSVAAPASSHPIHVRSGSCPSQLLQNLDQQHAQYFGSQRVKQKERPSMHNARTSNDHEVAASNLRAKTNGGQHVATANYQLTAMFHRKSQSLDANTIAQQMDGTAAAKSKSSGQR